MKKLFNCFVLAMLCFALPLASCSKDEPSSNEGENPENNNGNNNNISTDVIEVTTQADESLVANDLIFEITSSTDNTAQVTGTSSEVNADDFTGGFKIPAYIKYQGTRYAVTSIGKGAFYGFKKMTSIILPSTLVSIGNKAFMHCQSLASVTLPNSITQIGSQGFCDCRALKEIYLPQSMKIIGEDAFDRANIEKVYVESTKPFFASSDSFSGYTLIDGTLIVPESAYNAYINKSPWCYFNNIYYEGLIEGEEIRQAVDLGLTVKWASENIGAKRHGSLGQYFAWGATEAYPDEKNKWTDVKYTDLLAQGVIDSNGNLTSKYDVASVNWGDKWRMPTLDEVKELLDKCTWTWTTVNYINGYNVTGPNGKSIFLPAAGTAENDDVRQKSLRFVGTQGHYWSASAISDSFHACYLFFSSSSHNLNEGSRLYGFPIRPVTE